MKEISKLISCVFLASIFLANFAYACPPDTVCVTATRDAYMDPADQAKLMENQDRARYYASRDQMAQQAQQETEAKKKEEQEKFCKSQPAVIDQKKESCILSAINYTNGMANNCSNLSWTLAYILEVNYQSNCRSSWAGQAESQKQACAVDAANARAELSKQCP